MQVSAQVTEAQKNTTPYERHRDHRLELLATLDKHGDWFKKEIEKCFSGSGPRELLLERSIFREEFADCRHGQPVKVIPLDSSGGYGCGDGLKGWGKRMGFDFFKDPYDAVRALQHWIEREDAAPRILHVVYNRVIERGYMEMSVRITCK